MIEGTPIHPWGSWHKWPQFFLHHSQALYSVTSQLSPPWRRGIHPPDFEKMHHQWGCTSSVVWSQETSQASSLSLCIFLGTLPLPMNKPGLFCWWDRDRVLVTVGNHQTHPRSKAAQPVGWWSQTHKGPRQRSQELHRGAESDQKNKLNT